MSPLPPYDILFPEDAIQQRIQGLASEIVQAKLPNLLVIALMKGSYMFAADMVRALWQAGVKCDIDFLTVSSYKGGLSSSQNVKIQNDIECTMAGHTVLILDDILDSGCTLHYVKAMLLSKGALDVKSCILLNKIVERVKAVEADFIGFDCPDRYVFGYGMDYEHHCRQWPMIAALRNAE